MKKIILASASPRRIDILSQYDLDIEVIPAEIEEKYRQGERPEQLAMSLAFQKALWVSKKREDELILAADTVVALKDRILGKPEDEEQAFQILEALSGKEHQVITGISLIRGKTKIVDYERTRVKFRELNKEQILKYIETSEPMDKAGAYGIQGYGRILVEKINGSYSNVVGLPLVKTDILLNRFFDFKIL